MKRLNCFSPLFLPPHSVVINSSRRQLGWGKNRSVACNTMEHVFTSKIAILLKQGGQKNCKIIKWRNVFSPFFLSSCSVFINASGRQWWRGKHWSVGCDIIDPRVHPNNGNLIEKRWLNELKNCQDAMLSCYSFCLLVLFY